MSRAAGRSAAGASKEAMGDKLEIARLLLAHFRGRADHVAVGNEDGSFAPKKLPEPLRPEWLAERHLGRQKCLGFYLMDEESKVVCSCVDFDNKEHAPDSKWKEKAETLAIWLVKAGLSPLVEVSASGSAAHVWLFFEEPTDAWLVRAWWDVAGRHARVPLKEIYPRQDRLREGGLGNLVRYPLWNLSHFVDVESDWEPVPAEVALKAVSPTSAAEIRATAFNLGESLEPVGPDVMRSPMALEEDGHVLPARVKSRLARTESLLYRRWNGDTTGLKDTSRSALALSIATELVRQFVPTHEIAAAVKYWGHANGIADKVDRARWLSDTVSKAYEFNASRMEERSAATCLLRDACHAYLDTLEAGKRAAVPSGIACLDVSIDGVAPGEMAVIAARPGHGKSVVGLQWVDHAAGMGVPCLVISEEMSALDIGRRTILAVSNLPQEHWDRETVPELRRDVDRHFEGRAPIFIVENCATIERAEDVIAQAVRLHGVGLVVVDYLQLLGSRQNRRYEQVTDISRRLKQAAKRHNVAVLALCQLNREMDKENREPRLSDLRDSGQIEQDADLVIFLQWPERAGIAAPKGQYRLFAAKRRNGPIRKPRMITTFDPDRQVVNRGLGEDLPL
jgi:replicative DNA helicase